MASWLKFLTASDKPAGAQGAQGPQVAESAQADNPILAVSGEENEEWLRHLATRNPTHRRAGSSINEEYQQWLVKRQKGRAAEQRALERALR